MPVTRVIDASVLIKAYVPEVLSEQAGAFLDAAAQGAVSLIAPDLIYAETGNILWKKHGLKELKTPDVREIIDCLVKLPLNIASSQSMVSLAVDLGILYRITVYDALYLALAEIYETKLITADKRLVNTLSRTEAGVSIEWLGSLKM